jgi:hypothetical protein
VIVNDLLKYHSASYCLLQTGVAALKSDFLIRGKAHLNPRMGVNEFLVSSIKTDSRLTPNDASRDAI